MLELLINNNQRKESKPRMITGNNFTGKDKIVGKGYHKSEICKKFIIKELEEGSIK